jgi:trimethylamine--corrinoid protein Co-methyltransferase
LSGASIGGAGFALDRWQVGRENVYLPLLSVLVGAELAVGLGLMDGATLLYPQRILYDQEVVQCISQICAGIEVDDTTLALDMISEVGSGGHFLGQKHTRDNLGKFWPPSLLLEKSSREDERYRDPREVALEEMKWILENHQVPPLDSRVQHELKLIIERAEEDLGMP